LLKRNNARERRILDDIIVDAHAPEERGMAWNTYLEAEHFPRFARLISSMSTTYRPLGFFPCFHADALEHAMIEGKREYARAIVRRPKSLDEVFIGARRVKR
jgi:hypothetical protein